MRIFRAAVLVFIWILGNVYAEDFYIVAPSALRLNYDETIAIAIDGNSYGSANVKIQDHPSKRNVIFEKSVSIQPRRPLLLKVNLNASKFSAEFLSNWQTEKFVSLSVSIHYVQKEIVIPISNQAGYVFVQSAKPMYNPRERAVFRITPLTEDGVPSQQKFEFQIKNPQGVVVNNKTFNDRRKEPNYFAEYNYQFPKYPILGEWKAVVRYGENLELNSSISFDLQEYVLPTFTVKFRLPSVILPSADAITIEIDSEYVYGRLVNGVVSLKLGVKKPGSEIITYFTNYPPMEFKHGYFVIGIPINKLKSHTEIGWFPGIAGSHFCVEATVVDHATGKPEIERDCSTPFSVSAYEISFKRCLNDFKPGLPSIFEADIKSFDGKPAANVPVTISAVADNLHHIKIKENTAVSKENGRVSFEIHPENHHKSVTLTLETKDPSYGPHQAKASFIQKAHKSKNSAFIAISRMSPLRLEPGDTFGRDVHFDPKGLQNIYYVVVARGKIVLMDKLEEGAYQIHRMEFKIKYCMAPSFRVIVFAHYGNDLIADSLKIEVRKTCNPKSEVTIETDFKELIPGGGGNIKLKGEKGTYVGLYGIDEAIYALSEKDVLTKEKMFDKLESHDLGCGPGGGSNVHSVLGNAGITVGTNKFSPSQAESCVAKKRKKRDLSKDLVFSYEGTYRQCCGKGIEKDRENRTCKERFEKAYHEMEAIKPNCSAVFYECCVKGKHLNITGKVYILGNSQNGDGGFIFLEHAEELRIERGVTFRTNFREIWIEKTYFLNSGELVIPASLPHSITTWVVQAVSINPTHGMCVTKPKKLVSFRKIFLHVHIPYSVKVFEQIEIEATVFNYGDKNLTAYVYMYGMDGICSETENGLQSKRKFVEIEKESAATVTFSVVPLKVQNFALSFVVISPEGNDKIEKILHVVPPGIREEKTFQIKLDPSNRQGREKEQIETEYYSDIIISAQKLQVTALNFILPNNTVPGTAICSITASGEMIASAVETTLNNPDNLIKQAHGCGEQTLISFAPTLYTMRYLRVTNQLTPEREAKGMELLRSGFANELLYRKHDGSFAFWVIIPGSTWLTAFVMKVFCQASDFLSVDKEVISNGLSWLINMQEADGSFIEKSFIFHRDMMGGVSDVDSMTAFVLITLSECRSYDQGRRLIRAKEKAKSFLEDRVWNHHKPLPTAIIAYALALTNSDSKQDANQQLLSMATRNRGYNYMYWQTENSARDIETAGYGLLTQVLLNNEEESNSIVNWLNTKQLKSGEFASTQDTVIALQALTEYAMKRNMPTLNLVSNITSSRNISFFKQLTFNNENALDVQEVVINDTDGSKIFVRTTGHGMGTLSMNMRYNVIKPKKEICKFEITYTLEENILVGEKFAEVNKAFRRPMERKRREILNSTQKPFDKKINIRRKRENENNKEKDYVLKLDICVRFLENGDAGISIVDVGLFSGFEPVFSQLDELVKDGKHFIQHYEKWNKGVVFHLEKIPSLTPYCFGFEMTRKYIVGNTQSSVIKVSDYYNPEKHCIQLYSPVKESALLRPICESGVCQCAGGGGCPLKEPFKKFMNIHMADRREGIRNMFCEEFNYVWKGRLSGRMYETEGRLNISLQIQEVIKAGAENKASLENKIVKIYAQDHCDTAHLYSGATYLIVGKDPPPRKVNNNVYYQYFLDSQSIVYSLVLGDNEENEELILDLEFVMNELKADGCLK